MSTTQIALLEQAMVNTDKKLDQIQESTDKKLQRIENKLDSWCKEIKDEYVSYKEFSPVKNVVYGMVGAILMAFIGGLLILVF